MMCVFSSKDEIATRTMSKYLGRLDGRACVIGRGGAFMAASAKWLPARLGFGDLQYAAKISLGEPPVAQRRKFESHAVRTWS